MAAAVIAVGLGVLIGGWQLALRNAAVREAIDHVLLKLPIFGVLIGKMQFAQICRTWGTLLGAGVPILTAIRIVQDITPYVPIAQPGRVGGADQRWTVGVVGVEQPCGVSQNHGATGQSRRRIWHPERDVIAGRRSV